MSQKDSMNDTLDKVIEMNEPIPYQECKMGIIYCTQELECRIAAAIAFRMIEKYYNPMIINIVNNGFEGQSPKDLWRYCSVVLIGVSPSPREMDTIRSMVHDKNIVWLDNKTRNIPMWTDYRMIPGDRTPKYSIVELAWRFYHDMKEPPESLKLLTGEHSIIEMSKML